MPLAFAGCTSALVLSLMLCVGCAKRYRVEGMVLAVDRPSRTLTVSHRAIPGFMPAMVMPFRAAAGEPLDTVQPGSRIHFQLHVKRDASLAKRISVVETREIEDGMRLETPAETLSVGDMTPDFALTAEDGRTVRLSDFAGRLVAINFLYTRCPLPEVCPRLAASFASLQRRFRDWIPDRFTMLSITLDPQYDSPEVLARYARSVRADPRGWRFLTGPKDDVAAIARRFGLIHWPEEGLIVHTSVTALIGSDGRLKALVEGSSYRLEQLADLVEHELAGGAAKR